MEIRWGEIQRGKNLVVGGDWPGGGPTAKEVRKVVVRSGACSMLFEGVHPIPFVLVDIQQNQELHEVDIVTRMGLPVHGGKAQEAFVGSWGDLRKNRGRVVVSRAVSCGTTMVGL